MNIKAKILVTYMQNKMLFDSKLNTKSYGYCFINRTVSIVKDPNNVYIDENEFGYIVVNKKAVAVARIYGNEYSITVG